MTGKRDIPWLLASPGILLVTLVALLPAAILIVKAFQDVDTGALTLENFQAIFDSKIFGQAFWRTLRIAFFVTLVSVIGGYPLALLIARANPLYSLVIFVIVLFPLMVSVVVRTFGWVVILGPAGIVNEALMGIGLISEPLTMTQNEFGIVVGETHLLMPYMVLALLSVLRRLEPQLEEAALSLGANPLVAFFRVILPMTVPGLLSGVLLVFSLAITAFATPLVMGGARTPLLSTLVYRYALTSYDWASAAAVAFVLAVIAVAFVAVQKTVARMWMSRHEF
ncbi:ABC transporter permease [Pseudooceanicola sp. 502str34]